MASTQVPPFETWPAEIRNRVFKYLAEDAQLYLSATEVVLHEFVHYTPPSPVRQPRLANVHHAEVTDFHFQLASTCTQLRTEYLPVLLANTTLWVHGKDCGANDVLSGLPLVYRSGIRRVATLETAALGFDTATFAMLPALESIEYNMEPLDWVPPTKVEFASYMAGMAYGYGLIQAHREWLYMGNDDQDFLFLLPGGIPMNITVTVAHCARIRLDSKRAMLAIRGVGPVPEKDDQECIVVSFASIQASEQLVLTIFRKSVTTGAPGSSLVVWKSLRKRGGTCVTASTMMPRWMGTSTS